MPRTRTQAPAPTRGEGRERILAAARDLFWSQGFEATSPRDVYDASGTGQGSFYHHFEGKLDLGATVLEAIADEEIAALSALAERHADPIARIEAWLATPREGSRGCKLGRFAYENAIAEPRIRDPIRAYFVALEDFLTDALGEAQRSGRLRGAMEPKDLAALIMATVQGGYVLARAYGDATRLTRALGAARTLLADQTAARRR